MAPAQTETNQITKKDRKEARTDAIRPPQLLDVAVEGANQKRQEVAAVGAAIMFGPEAD